MYNDLSGVVQTHIKKIEDRTSDNYCKIQFVYSVHVKYLKQIL